jgi:hypothetical protein
MINVPLSPYIATTHHYHHPFTTVYAADDDADADAGGEGGGGGEGVVGVGADSRQVPGISLAQEHRVGHQTNSLVAVRACTGGAEGSSVLCAMRCTGVRYLSLNVALSSVLHPPRHTLLPGHPGHPAHTTSNADSSNADSSEPSERVEKGPEEDAEAAAQDQWEEDFESLVAANGAAGGAADATLDGLASGDDNDDNDDGDDGDDGDGCNDGGNYNDDDGVAFAERPPVASTPPAPYPQPVRPAAAVVVSPPRLEASSSAASSNDSGDSGPRARPTMPPSPTPVPHPWAGGGAMTRAATAQPVVVRGSLNGGRSKRRQNGGRKRGAMAMTRAALERKRAVEAEGAGGAEGAEGAGNPADGRGPWGGECTTVRGGVVVHGHHTHSKSRRPVEPPVGVRIHRHFLNPNRVDGLLDADAAVSKDGLALPMRREGKGGEEGDHFVWPAPLQGPTLHSSRLAERAVEQLQEASFAEDEARVRLVAEEMRGAAAMLLNVPGDRSRYVGLAPRLLPGDGAGGGEGGDGEGGGVQAMTQPRLVGKQVAAEWRQQQLMKPRMDGLIDSALESRDSFVDTLRDPSMCWAALECGLGDVLQLGGGGEGEEEGGNRRRDRVGRWGG